MTDNVESATAAIGADLAALRSDVARLAEKIGELAQQGKQAAKNHFAEAFGEAQDKIVNSAANAQSQIRVAGSDLEASIERAPLIAMAVAFGIGLGLGMMSHSRR
jgi:ElaB/YqjD/DUF883 family membrane-anchored ribosome-binding protein